MKFVIYWALILALAVTLACVGCTSLTLEEDTYTDGQSPNGGCGYNGAVVNIISRRVTWIFGGYTIPFVAWVKFSLGGISTVNSANLTLTAGCATQDDTSGIEGNVHTLARTGAGWDEDTLSGSLSPSTCYNLPSNIGNTFTGTLSSGLLKVSVTTQVQNALSESASSISFRIDPPDSLPPEQYIEGTFFCSKESSDSSKWPRLDVS